MRRFTGSLFVFFALGSSLGCDPAPAPVDGGPLPVLDAGPTCTSAAECDDGVFCNGVERCGALGDAGVVRCLPAVGPACGAGGTCDEATDTCEADCDVDDDGETSIACGGNDCDDEDAARAPGHTEICDAANVDEDCDPTTIGARDLDLDGFVDGLCCNGTLCGDDCNDARRDVSPDGNEVCNGFDDDCNATIDEGVDVAGFFDGDSDLYGDTSMPTRACAGARNFAIEGGDCDDTTVRRSPGLLEACDALDNDCDLDVDEDNFPVSWYRDADGDGFGDRAMVVRSCAPPSADYSLLPTDCDDADEDVRPGAAEVCDGRDDDCNGRVDFVFGTGDGEDDDLDGHADTGCGGNDCNDRDGTTYTDASELCDGRDNDCDGTVDDGTGVVSWYRDADGDGDGAIAAPAVSSCTAVLGSSRTHTDCDDTAATVRPGAVEICDGVDQNCDGAATGEDIDGDGQLFAGVVCTGGARGALPRTDCNDAVAAVRSGATETCNATDDDCDGTTDETPPPADVGHDPLHCGSCSTACTTGEICRAGRCGGDRRILFVHDPGLTMGASFGGLAGADAICQAAADAAFIGGTYRAFLSTSMASAATRLTHATVPYVRVDGMALATNWTDLTDGMLAVAPNLNASGVAITREVWTGSRPNGLFNTGGTTGDCVDYTSETDSGVPYVGVSNETDADWTSAYLQVCNRDGLAFYCVEQ